MSNNIWISKTVYEEKWVMELCKVGIKKDHQFIDWICNNQLEDIFRILNKADQICFFNEFEKGSRGTVLLDNMLDYFVTYKVKGKRIISCGNLKSHIDRFDKYLKYGRVFEDNLIYELSYGELKRINLKGKRYVSSTQLHLGI